jgi:hypothetical protein
VEERVLFDGWSSSENLEGEFCVAGSKRHGRMRLWNWIWRNVVEKMKRGVYWIECDWRIELLLWLILWDENEKNPITFVVIDWKRIMKIASGKKKLLHRLIFSPFFISFFFKK